MRFAQLLRSGPPAARSSRGPSLANVERARINAPGRSGVDISRVADALWVRGRLVREHRDFVPSETELFEAPDLHIDRQLLPILDRHLLTAPHRPLSHVKSASPP